MADVFEVQDYNCRARPKYRYKLVGPNGAGKRGNLAYFKTKTEAQHACEKRNAEHRATGFLGRLTNEQRIEAEVCFARCAEAGVSLTQAVDAHLSRMLTLEKSETVGMAYDHMMESKQDRGKLYRTQLKNMLAPFIAANRDRKLDEFNVDELDRFLASRGGAAKSRNNLRGYLCILWNHAVKKGMTRSNPATATSLIREVPKDAAVLTPQALRAMFAATNSICPDSIAPLAIQAFAGLRSAEVAKLEWSDVDMDERRIVVAAKKAKTRTRRVIAISDNLYAFLAPLAANEGHVTRSCHRVEFPKIRDAVKKAGFEWDDNALRHSFVSYRLAQTQDENLTALEAGHSTAMLHKNYKGLVSPKAAKEWWSIMPLPADRGNVLAMPLPVKGGRKNGDG